MRSDSFILVSLMRCSAGAPLFIEYAVGVSNELYMYLDEQKVICSCERLLSHSVSGTMGGAPKHAEVVKRLWACRSGCMRSR